MGGAGVSCGKDIGNLLRGISGGRRCVRALQSARPARAGGCLTCIAHGEHTSGREDVWSPAGHVAHDGHKARRRTLRGPNQTAAPSLADTRGDEVGETMPPSVCTIKVLLVSAAVMAIAWADMLGSIGNYAYLL